MKKLNRVKNWLVSMAVAGVVLFLARPVLARYVEDQWVLSLDVNTDQVEVWMQNDGNDREIYFDDGSGGVQVTDNNWDDLLPSYSDGVIAWQSMVDNRGWQIMVYDVNLGVTTQLTYGGNPSEYAKASSAGVVWEMPKSAGSDVFLFDGVEVTRLTNDEAIDELPEVDSEYVVWLHSEDGEDREIMAYEITSKQIFAVTNDQLDQSQLALYGGEVFFRQFDGNDYEIYGIGIASKAKWKVSDNLKDDGRPEIDKGKLVWMSERDGPDLGFVEEQVVIGEPGETALEAEASSTPSAELVVEETLTPDETVEPVASEEASESGISL